MKILYYFLVYVNYNGTDTALIDQSLGAAFKTYQPWGVGYGITTDKTKADLYISMTPNMKFKNSLAETDGNVFLDPKYYSRPVMRVKPDIEKDLLPAVLTHELGHFLGYITHNSDPLSIYHYYVTYGQKITKKDSIILDKILKQ